jgi:hypothetical protein
LPFCVPSEVEILHLTLTLVLIILKCLNLTKTKGLGVHGCLNQGQAQVDVGHLHISPSVIFKIFVSTEYVVWATTLPGFAACVITRLATCLNAEVCFSALVVYYRMYFINDA